jgi:hypothetical protein
MSSRVGEVRLHLRLPAYLAGDAAAIRARIERETLIEVLEQVERRLHAACGAEAIIHVRHLSLVWQLDVDALGSEVVLAGLADELARDLLAEFAAAPPAERLRPVSGTAVMFADAHHAAAAWLADLVDSRPRRWFHAALPDAAATWQEVAAQGQAALAAVLGWLGRMERRDAALASAPDAVLAAAADAVPEIAGVVALVRATRRVSNGAPPHPIAGATAVEPAGAPSRETPAAAREAPPPIETPATLIAATTRLEAASSDRVPAVATGVPASPGATAPAEVPASAGTQRVPIRGAVAGHPVATRYAGLFYLVGRVLELELAEHLWTAGVAEGPVLAAIARALIVDDDDPAWAWFGGAFERPPPAPAVELWAADELGAAVQHALGRRLVRFGVVTTPAALGAQLDALAATLPLGAGASAGLAGLVRRGAAALAMIVAARLGQPASWPLMRALLRRDGQLLCHPGAIHVVQSAASIDLAHRRAGLDHNPGHVPWLGRKLLLEFAGATSL